MRGSYEKITKKQKWSRECLERRNSWTWGELYITVNIKVVLEYKEQAGGCGTRL